MTTILRSSSLTSTRQSSVDYPMVTSDETKERTTVKYNGFPCIRICGNKSCVLIYTRNQCFMTLVSVTRR